VLVVSISRDVGLGSERAKLVTPLRAIATGRTLDDKAFGLLAHKIHQVLETGRGFKNTYSLPVWARGLMFQTRERLDNKIARLAVQAMPGHDFYCDDYLTVADTEAVLDLQRYLARSECAEEIRRARERESRALECRRKNKAELRRVQTILETGEDPGDPDETDDE
jgi:hypothetical protein